MNPVNWLRIVSTLLMSMAACPHAAAAEDDVLEKASAASVATAKGVLPGLVAITTAREPHSGGTNEGLSLEDLPQAAEAESAEAIMEFLRRSKQSSDARTAVQSSGFLVSAAGLIVTASYAVEDVDKIIVRLHNGKEYEAKLVGADPMSQVALLRIEEENSPFLKLGDSSEVEVGQWAMSVGHPFGLGSAVSLGTVGAIGVHGLGTDAFEDYIQTDATVQRGCSGGPLVNARGEVIGMNVAIASRSGSFEGVSYAVPVNVVKAVKDQIAASGKMVYSYLGIAIHELTWELADSLGLEEPKGVIVGSVGAETPAQEAGLAGGDVILEIDGRATVNVGSLRKMVAFIPPGTEVTLTILRGGERKEVAATMATRPTGD